jgi:CheY-like chemotaxis protein
VQASAYDLVFMDMQMPVMDGVTATRELRKLQGLGNVPVVAMTANAMEQDRRKCLEAGMNDYLVKPIEPKDMWTILVRWIRPRQAPGNAAHVEASAQTVPSAGAANHDEDGIPIGIAGLDTALGLKRMMGKKPLYLSMLRRYVAGQAHLARDIRQALATGDLATAERLAHTSRGVSGSVGAVLVEECSGTVESALRQGHDLRAVESLLASLEKTLDGLLGALNVHLGTG